MPELNINVLAGGEGMTTEVAQAIVEFFRTTENLAVANVQGLAKIYQIPKETAEWLTLLAAWANSISAPSRPQTDEEWIKWAENLEGESDEVKAARYCAKKLKGTRDSEKRQWLIGELVDVYQALSGRTHVSPTTVAALGDRSVAIGGDVSPGTTIFTGRQ